MCTAVSYKTKDFYFGRTLDYESTFPTHITVTPRRFPFKFRHGGTMSTHHALIGMAYVTDGYPLYYDGMNEKGLCMAGLNFVGNAVYRSPVPEGDNICQFEFIPWILGQCATVAEARILLSRIRITDTPFSKELPVSDLHWMIADRQESVTVESVADGVMVYDNPVGVLTNNPPFDFHLYNLRNHMQVSTTPAVNRFSRELKLEPYSNGMGGIGLPGDLSSASRFVRAAFVKLNSVSGSNEEENVSQFFHILNAVAMPKGTVQMADGRHEITLYSACCNAQRGIYYYTTYDNSRICAVDMHREDLLSDGLISYPLLHQPDFYLQNQASGKDGAPT